MSVLIDATADGYYNADAAFDVPFSFTGWIKLTSILTTTEQTIFSKAKSGVGVDYCLVMKGDSSGKLEIIAASALAGTTVLSAGTWYHVAFTISSSGTALKAYLNGNLEIDFTDNYPSLAQTDIWVGRNGQWGNDLHGSITQCRTWTTELTQAEVQAEKASTVLVKTASAFSDWSLLTFDDTADDSGNSHPLTANGTPTTDSDNPTGQGPVVNLIYRAKASA